MIRYSLAIVLLLSLCNGISADNEPSDTPQADVEAPQESFFGVWKTHFRTTSIQIIINSDQTAYVIYKSESNPPFGKFNWRAAPGGIIVESLPRYRLWQGPEGKHDLVRAQMEPLHPDMTGKDLRHFPGSFYMQRVLSENETTRLPAVLVNRALPPGWEDKEPPGDFDAMAGVPR